MTHPHAASLESRGDLVRAKRAQSQSGPVVNLGPDAVRVRKGDHFPDAARCSLGDGIHLIRHARTTEPVLHRVKRSAIGDFPADVSHVVSRSLTQEDAKIMVVHAQGQRTVGLGCADGKSQYLGGEPAPCAEIADFEAQVPELCGSAHAFLPRPVTPISCKSNPFHVRGLKLRQPQGAQPPKVTSGELLLHGALISASRRSEPVSDRIEIGHLRP
jgi:hypothetical protein